MRACWGMKDVASGPGKNLFTNRNEIKIVNQPSSKHKRTGRWRSFLPMAPGIGVSLLPVGLCPACWPAYAGLLSSLGLGFLGERTYLLPLTILFLIAAVCSLYYRARTRWGYGPFVAGLIASIMLYVGKFVLHSNPMLYVGVALLVGASLWNAWPERRSQNTCCPGPDKA